MQAHLHKLVRMHASGVQRAFCMPAGSRHQAEWHVVLLKVDLFFFRSDSSQICIFDPDFRCEIESVRSQHVLERDALLPPHRPHLHTANAATNLHTGTMSCCQSGHQLTPSCSAYGATGSRHL